MRIEWDNETTETRYMALVDMALNAEDVKTYAKVCAFGVLMII